MKTTIKLALLAIWLLFSLPFAVFSGTEPTLQNSQAPKVFLDCQARGCDLNYIRKEIGFVNYVRDRESAELHVLITTQPTGAGGREYTLAFLGLGRHKGRDVTLKYYSRPNDSEDELRKGIVSTLRKGLVPFIYDTPLSEFISVSFSGPQAGVEAKPEDPWKNWVFRLGLRGNINLESQYRGVNYNLSLSANQTTEAAKFFIWLNGDFNNRRYFLADGEEILSHSQRKTLFSRYVKSIGGHWAAGVFVHFYSSTYDNAELFATIGPGFEYNYFPYEESTRRELRFQYQLKLENRNYIEETVFSKLRETLLSQSLSVIFELKEPWGNVGIQLEGSNYLHDFSKNRIKVDTGLSMRISKGLSGNLDFVYSRIGDQLSLPKAEASVEEVLLELKRLATSYNLRLRLGLSFSFGSIYSNVVNSRFGNT